MTVGSYSSMPEFELPLQVNGVLRWIFEEADHEVNKMYVKSFFTLDMQFGWLLHKASYYHMYDYKEVQLPHKNCNM